MFEGVLQSVTTKLKAAYLNVSETELKVLDATNEEPWGPHGAAMAEIARAAEHREQYNEVMGIIHQRLQERNENWRLCYKALLLLDFLCKQGPRRVADDLQRSVHILESLRDMFEYKDAQGRDHGVNVRQRAKELVMLVNSPQRLMEEREKASKNAGKYKGVSADDMRHGTGFSGSSSSHGGGGGFGSVGFGSNSRGSGSGGYGSGGGSGYGSGGLGPGSGGGGGGYGSSYSKDGSKDTFGGDTSSSAGYGSVGKHGDDGEDPFEATRKRIEKLKADGALSDVPRDPPTQAISGTLIDPPTFEQKKGAPKKLSDVKVDPKFATTFSGITASSSRTMAPPSLAPPPGFKVGSTNPAPARAPAPATAAPNMMDLLGDLTVPAAPPVPATNASFGLAPTPQSPAAGFGMAPPLTSSMAAASTTAPSGAAFPAFNFDSPPPRVPAAVAVPVKPTGDGFDFLAGFGAAPAQQPQVPQQPSIDLFASPAAPRQTAPVAAAPAFDNLFASPVAPQPPAASGMPAAVQPAHVADPFAVLASAAAPRQAPAADFGSLFPPAATASFPNGMAAGTAAAAAASRPLDDFFAAPAAPFASTSGAADPFAAMLAPVAPAGGLRPAMGTAHQPMAAPMSTAPPQPKSADPFAGLGF